MKAKMVEAKFVFVDSAEIPEPALLVNDEIIIIQDHGCYMAYKFQKIVDGYYIVNQDEDKDLINTNNNLLIDLLLAK